MTRPFCFIGDPGNDKNTILQTLREVGLEPNRIEPGDDVVDLMTGDSPPVAIMLGVDVDDRRAQVALLRQDKALANVPILARIPELDPEAVERAFIDGVDDFVVDHSPTQFAALVAMLQKVDPWRVMRAPAGIVLLAEQDRLERIRLGYVLRRNGFDIRFASDAKELEQSLDEMTPRAVVASAELLNGNLSRLLETSVSMGGSALPWVIVQDESSRSSLVASLLEQRLAVALEPGSDAERLTFLMNSLLMPVPPSARRTPRLFYGAPVTFRQESDQEGRTFYGHIYNVNMGGIFIRTLTPFPLQTKVEVEFRPPFGRGKVMGKAQVAWCKEFSDAGSVTSPAGMGVQFVDWAPADKAGFEVGYSELVALQEGEEVVQATCQQRFFEQRKATMFSCFTGGVAHALNNVLAVVRGNVQLVQREAKLDHETRQDLSQILIAADQGFALVDQLRSVGGRQNLKPEQVELNNVVGGLETMLRHVLRDDIDLVVSLAEGLGSIEIDRKRVERVIVDLVKNAQDATPQDGKLFIATSNAASFDEVVLEVSDTGPEQSAETLDRIFDPFFLKERSKNTGLRLAAVHGIVLQSGGRIEALSRPGTGTTFRVSFPRVMEEEDSSAPVLMN